MGEEAFARTVEVQKAGFAAELGCDPAAFDREGLTIVSLPPNEKEPAIALSAWFGEGRVLSVHPAVLDWARANASTAPATGADPERAVLSGAFLSDLAAQATRAGIPSHFNGAGIVFALRHQPPLGTLPSGLVFRPLTDAERQANSTRYPNSLETPHDLAYACGVFEEGRLAAAVGVIDHHDGRYELGIDVDPQLRQRGVAKYLIVAATAWILAQGKVPVYSCGATNVRSQRVALSCGFVPIAVVSAVIPSTRQS